MSKRPLSSCASIMMALFLLSRAAVSTGQTPPQDLTPAQIHVFDAETEVIDGAFPGLLVIPNARPNYRDEKYQRPYHLAVHVYAALPAQDGETGTVYRRRFLVCAADRDALPFTRQVARLLLLLYGERHQRLHDDHPENRPTVNVWLTERVEAGLTADTGGEQFQNQIYLVNIHRERPAIEWAREIAHEYGHYALPGISGFKAPEEWANGVLGERLFLKWIRDDLKAGHLQSSELSLVTPSLLDEYYARSIWPLIRRILRQGMDAQIIARTNAEGMDYYTGLAMYVDTLYGTPCLLDAILDTRSSSSLTFPHALDFLTGVLSALRSEKEFTLTLPALGENAGENIVHFYLPAGSWAVGIEGSVLMWHVAPDVSRGIACGAKAVTSRKGGWCRLTYLRASSAPAHLVFRRHG